jgi:Arm DNA-binding domain
MAKMTRAFVESAPLPTGDKLRALYWDSGKGALPGFGLSVTKNGARSYVAQARVNGKTRRMTIGQHSERLTFELAKAKAKAYLLQMDNGIDPREEERRDEAVQTSLRETLEDYLLNHRTGHGKPLRSSTQADMRRHVEQNLIDLADTPIANITRNVCLERFNDLTERGLTGQANQCMVTLRALINYAASTSSARCTRSSRVPPASRLTRSVPCGPCCRSAGPRRARWTTARARTMCA